MSSNKQSTVILISAERSELSVRENLNRSIEMAEHLSNLELPYTIVEGVYKGTREQTFMVKVKLYERVEHLKELAKMFNQDAILEIAQNRYGYVHDLSNRGEYESYLGILKFITPSGEEYYTTMSDGRSFVFE